VEGAELTLELSVQSPSDKEHCFKNLYFGGVGEDEDLRFDRPGHRLPHLDSKHSFHDLQHGWINGRQVDAPNGNAFLRMFQPLYLTFKEGLPQVKAVTRFVLRRQCRRKIQPKVLGSLLDKLPRLQSLIYEPWQSWDKTAQDFIWDFEYVKLIESHLPKALKRISVFEETNEAYITSFRPTIPHTAPDVIRVASPAVSAAFAKRSLSLEQLSVTFMIEASDFFRSCQQDWRISRK
ncbi:Oxoglutarate iron-dependent oxygenase, partial [Colletotrichum scovillei]